MKRCSRCQAVYTDDVRWCPADGTPTEEVAPAPISPAALAAAAKQIPEGAPTLHDMQAVGPGSGGWNIPSTTIPESAGITAPTPQQLAAARNPNATMLGASPLPQMPLARPVDHPVGDALPGATSPVAQHNATMIGAPSPVRQASPTPAPPVAASPSSTHGGQSSNPAQQPSPAPVAASPAPPPPVAYSPNATMIGTSAAPNPLTTMIGGVSPFAAPRGPALSPELATIAATIPSGPTAPPAPIVDAGPHGPLTIPGATSPDVRAPAHPTPPPPLSPPSTVPGALIPPLHTPLMSTFMGTTSEPPRTPHGSSTSSADLGPKGNTFMGASPVARAPAAPTPAPPLPPPSTVPGAIVPPIHSPLMSTFTGTTAEPPRTPHGSATSPAELAAQLPPRAPAHHQPGPVSLGWNVPDMPADASMTGPAAPAATSPAALAAAATADPPGRSNASTLVGFAPSPDVLRAIQDQRAKLAAQQTGRTQPMATPEISPEAYIPSGSAPAESYASMAVAHSMAMTAVGSATDPAGVVPTAPLNSTMPALSPLPMQPAVVLMASQHPSVASAISQAPLPSVSMPHAVVPAPLPSVHQAVVVSQSMTMAAAQLPSVPRPPTASLLEAPPFQAAAAAASVKRASTAGATDKHRAVGGNKTLWIVFVVIAVAMIGATIAILLTR